MRARYKGVVTVTVAGPPDAGSGASACSIVSGRRAARLSPAANDGAGSATARAVPVGALLRGSWAALDSTVVDFGVGGWGGYSCPMMK